MNESDTSEGMRVLNEIVVTATHPGDPGFPDCKPFEQPSLIKYGKCESITCDDLHSFPGALDDN